MCDELERVRVARRNVVIQKDVQKIGTLEAQCNELLSKCRIVMLALDEKRCLLEVAHLYENT